VLVLLVLTWMMLLICGGALMVRPALGTGVQANQGPTPTGFATAFYVAGDAMTTVGASDIAPRTAFFRIAYVMMSVIGICTLTLTVTYFLEIYNALQARNTFVSKLHHATGDTGDAAELITGLGSGGDFQHGYTHLAEMAARRPNCTRRTIFTRAAVLPLPRAALRAGARRLRHARHHHADQVGVGRPALRLAEGIAAVMQVWNSAMKTVVELSIVFLPGGIPEHEPDEATKELWRRRYRAACERLRQAGIQTMADQRAGEDVYINLRARWHRYIEVFAEHMMHSLDVIDPIGSCPEETQRRPESQHRLRAVGDANERDCVASRTHRSGSHLMRITATSTAGRCRAARDQPDDEEHRDPEPAGGADEPVPYGEWSSRKFMPRKLVITVIGNAMTVMIVSVFMIG
jgi:hypothetical protein